jgi:hypothetical protein
VIISVFIIFAALATIFFLKSRKVAQIAEAKSEMKLISATSAVKVGEQFKFSLAFKNFDTDVSSFDAVVSYDPETVRIDEINPSNIFPVTARKLIEDFKNRFIVTGVQKESGQKLAVMEGELAEMTATALKPGKAIFSFIVDGRKYTNMVNSKVENIPVKTNMLEIMVEE